MSADLREEMEDAVARILGPAQNELWGLQMTQAILSVKEMALVSTRTAGARAFFTVANPPPVPTLPVEFEYGGRAGVADAVKCPLISMFVGMYPMVVPEDIYRRLRPLAEPELSLLKDAIDASLAGARRRLN